VSWTAVSNTQFGTDTIQAIAYGGNRFVAVGNKGKAAYSTDGVTWTAVSDSKFGTASIYAIVYGGNRFVAVSAGGKAAYWAAITAKLVFNANGYVSWVRA
jgi:photosystem II stability/assembly factor-like uncharacterized protein